ncbi:MAG: DMT family transporter [Pseudomonadota bacterium]|nr:DMT family transporter [Pseudomonadota bacterium]
MDALVILLVLIAAVLHAVWNALVKVDDDRLMTMAVVICTTGILSPILLLLGPNPAPESWPYLATSVILNNIYFLFLIEAYRNGDLSHAYPLARGSAPLMVAAGAMLFSEERLGLSDLVGVVLVSGAIISLVLFSGDERQKGWKTVVYPLLTGLMIASYTVIDGIGVRLSGSPAGFIGWLFLLSPLPITLISIIRRGSGFLSFLQTRWKSSILAGCLNFGSYGLAIWALSMGTMAHVSALRETSVIIAALIGTLFLGESFGLRRIYLSIIVVFGVIIMNLPVPN